jgi:hypothetical protein
MHHVSGRAIRSAIRLGLLAAVGLLILLPVAYAQQAAGHKPNFVFIWGDVPRDNQRENPRQSG